jgi:hypothetical protein
VNIRDGVLSGDSDVAKQIASQFGISPEQVSSAVSALLPALAGGLKERLIGSRGAALSNLFSDATLSKFDVPESLTTPAALTQGNFILNQVFARGDLIDIASGVAQDVGIRSGAVTNMLPIATVVLGSLVAKGTAGGHGSLTSVLDTLVNGGLNHLAGSVKGSASNAPK